MNISNLSRCTFYCIRVIRFNSFCSCIGLGNSVLAGGFTMSFLILPVIVVASQEAIRAVPEFLREASYGMGATKWQTIVNVVLPAAIPGILTGVF